MKGVRNRVDENDVRRIAGILGVKLAKNEEAALASQISRLLSDIMRVMEVETRGVPPTHYRKDLFGKEASSK